MYEILIVICIVIAIPLLNVIVHNPIALVLVGSVLETYCVIRVAHSIRNILRAHPRPRLLLRLKIEWYSYHLRLGIWWKNRR